MADGFTWRDGERQVRFGDGVAAEAEALLEGSGFGEFALLTTERAQGSVPGLARRAASVTHVPQGRVDEVSAALLGAGAGGLPLVALGGGRVVDVTKAIAGATGSRAAAIPTTLSGAEMTPFHRLPAGVEGARMVRPQLVVADPRLMASAPLATLAASAMNALAHAMEALYTPLANPVTSMAALRAAELLAGAVTRDPPGRSGLALGAVLAGYASGATGIAVHHALCQTIVRSAAAPHAQTNAVMLPHSARLMATRAPAALSELGRALGDGSGDPEGATAALSRLAARSGHTRLSTLGVEEDELPEIAAAVAVHRLLANTPDPPGEAELLEVLRAAL